MKNYNEILQKLISNKKKYYIKVKSRKKVNYENDYFQKVKDPDGKIRILAKERSKKILDFKHINKFFKTENMISKNLKILDVGCAFGWFLSILPRRWKKFGLDVSAYALSYAKKYAKVYKADFTKFTDKEFDIITMIHVIEHLDKPEIFIKKARSLLKKNGLLIIETPDFDSAMARKYGVKFRLFHDPTHISLFSYESLTRLIRDSKFKIVKVDFPYFDTKYFNKKELGKLFRKHSKKNFSPPFYGSVMTFYCKKI